MVTCTHNPSYLEEGDQEDGGLRSAWVKSESISSNKPHTVCILVILARLEDCGPRLALGKNVRPYLKNNKNKERK
jgi:hypothetical protein